MSPKEVQLIKNSWRLFRAVDPVVVGDAFYSKLFFDYPQVKNMFKTSKEEQSKKLIEMLNVIVGRLDTIDEISGDIAALAVRHVQYGVKPQHYMAVGKALLWTLQKGLGHDWTPDAAAAWTKCFSILSDTMIKAAYS